MVVLKNPKNRGKKGKMAKGKKKNKQAGEASGKTRYRLKPWEWTVIGVAAIFAAWMGWQWQRNNNMEAAFLEHAHSGEAALAHVKVGHDAGGGHLQPGRSAGYSERFPTSGPHDLKWVDPGIYDTVQPATKLVHSVEHGMVVIYYDAPPPEAMAKLKEWAGLYMGPWSGVVVTQAPGIGEELVLTAWNQTLRLRTFEAEAVAAFIDRFRGRGPEHPVR
jgi:hypothetical protein